MENVELLVLAGANFEARLAGNMLPVLQENVTCDCQAFFASG